MNNDVKQQQAFGFLEEIKKESLTLFDRYLIPPFSVLDARQGYWQDRKREWTALGMHSELGRLEGLTLSSRQVTTENLNYYRNRKNKVTPGGSLLPACDYSNKQRGDGGGKPIVEGDEETSGTSLFDPVLCEVIYRWFCPQGGKVLDPFAGGSVRGIVASRLGYDYTGVELRAEQVEANELQAQQMELTPQWITGDSKYIDSLAMGEYDLIFSCPPYFNLEVYSDLDGELSAIPSYEGFIKEYRDIVFKSVKLLKNNRFACFVVGDMRDKVGFYRNFVSDTIAAFQDAGMLLYNEAILVTCVGSLSLRVGRAFQSYRKLGKTHQNVLVFYRGSMKDMPSFEE